MAPSRQRKLQPIMDDDRETTEMEQLVRSLGERPSRSADAARERELAEIRAMSVKDRILLALRLGRRDRAIREAFERSRTR
jgi:hypothetical protein